MLRKQSDRCKTLAAWRRRRCLGLSGASARAAMAEGGRDAHLFLPPGNL